MKHLRPHSQSGFTVVEAMLSSLLLSSLLYGFVTLTQRAQAGQDEIERVFTEEITFLNAVNDIRTELQRSGFVDDGSDYPMVFPNNTVGNHDAAFAAAAPHAHEDGNTTSQDIVFLVGQDADGDGWPEYDADGNMDWALEEAAFLLVPDATGGNTLQRRMSDGTSRDMLGGVTRAVFDDPDSAAFAIPLGCVRLELEMIAMRGGEERYRLSRIVTVRLRNGGL